jgi:recombination protein RecA
MFAEGISRAGSILDVAIDMKLLEKRGSWFSFGDQQIGQGREQTKTVIAEDKDLQKKLVEAIYEKLKETNVVVPAKGGADDGAPALED